MLVKDALNGLAIQRPLIPKAISLCLHFPGIEVCQPVFHLRNCLLASAVVEQL